MNYKVVLNNSKEETYKTKDDAIDRFAEICKYAKDHNITDCHVCEDDKIILLYKLV